MTIDVKSAEIYSIYEKKIRQDERSSLREAVKKLTLYGRHEHFHVKEADAILLDDVLDLLK